MNIGQALTRSDAGAKVLGIAPHTFRDHFPTEIKVMKIILAIDGSPCSDAAIEEVARRPWPMDSQVRIISVIETPAPLVAEPYMMAGSYFVEAEKICRRQAEDAVEQAAAKLGSGQNGNPQVSTQVLAGSPKRTIVEEAEEWGADLIVVGSHGYRSWERMLLGSVSQAVAAHARCSVEIVRCRKESLQSVVATSGSERGRSSDVES